MAGAQDTGAIGEEVSSPAWHSTAPARKTSSTPAAASASRSGSASAFQKLRAVGRSQRTLAAATGISATCPAPGLARPPCAPARRLREIGREAVQTADEIRDLLD